MICPIDREKLQKSIFYRVEVDYCPRCLGIFLEQEELRLAKDEKDKDLNWLDTDLWEDKKKFNVSLNEKLCPKCMIPLYGANYDGSKIRVDICRKCKGVWLDRLEFSKIIDYLKEKADYEVLHNYMKNLLKEAGEVFIGPESFKEELEDFLTVLKLFNYKFAVQHPLLTKLIAALPK